MKNIHSAVLLICFVTSLGAAEQTLRVTPQSLEGWTVTAADKSSLAQQVDLVLPAGAQLSRTCDADTVVVKLKSRVRFGQAVEDMPTLEIGPIAVIFSREDTKGQLLVFSGDQLVPNSTIPVELDADGSVATPVEVEFALSRTSGEFVVAALDHVVREATSPISTPVEVVMTAGGHDALPIQGLTVRLITPDDPQNKNGTADDPAHSGKSGEAKNKKSAGGGGGFAAGGDLDPSASTAEKDPKASPNFARLEVYTPPAQRHGRVDAIRAAVKQTKKL